MRVRSPLAYVRQQDGSTVALAHGDGVPDGSDLDHVEKLHAQGVLERGDPAPNPEQPTVQVTETPQPDAGNSKPKPRRPAEPGSG